MRSPTARTLAYLRDQLKVDAVQVVEKWIAIKGHPGGGVRKDLFDCIDIVYIQGRKWVNVQSTSSSNHATRIAKIKESAQMRCVLRTDCAVEVWSFAKKPAIKKDGTKSKKFDHIPRVTALGSDLMGNVIVISDVKMRNGAC